jgi:hypothetical protein
MRTIEYGLWPNMLGVGHFPRAMPLAMVNMALGQQTSGGDAPFFTHISMHRKPRARAFATCVTIRQSMKHTLDVDGIARNNNRHTKQSQTVGPLARDAFPRGDTRQLLPTLLWCVPVVFVNPLPMPGV